MMSTTTSRVQPLLDDEEEEAEGGLRRITGTDTSGDRDDEALPPVGGSIGVVSHPDGYQYVVKARLAVTVHALLDVVETSNTFSATVELGLEWEVSEDQWIGCETFWRDHFIPKVLRVFFDNAKDRENLFAADANEDERVGRDDVGAPLVDSDTGKRARLFRLRRRRTVEFRQPLALQHYPFDYQVLAIRCVAEGAELFGKYFQLELLHPKRSNYGPGRHTVVEDADHVDDLDIESIFALDGRDLAKPGSERPRPQEYAVLLFVSRQYNSTLMNAIMPVVFIEILSVIVYWVEPCDVADRAAITTTLFLAAVTFKTYMSTLLPALPYLTSVERFLMAGTVLLLCQGVMIAWVGTWCVNDENTPGFPGTPYSLKFKKHEPNVDDAENWRKSPDGTTAAYWRDDDADYWRSSDEARRPGGVLADQVAYYLTIFWITTTFLFFFNRILKLYYKLYRIDYEKAVAESLGDERALNKQSILSYVARRACCCYSPAPAVWRRGAGHADKTRQHEERRRRAVAFFRDLASQSLEGYTNPEMRHLPSKQVRCGAAGTAGPVVEERFASTKGRETEEPAAAAAVAEKDRCIIFDVGTGEAKAITCSYVNGADGKHAVRVEDLDNGSFRDKETGGKLPVRDLCHGGDASQFINFVGDKILPRVVVQGSAKPPFDVVELKKAPGLFVVSAWAEEDKKKWPAPVGTAVVFCNRQLYSPELAKKRLARAAQKQAALEVGDRVRAKVAIRYARDAEGSAVPIGDDAAPEAIILPGAGGAVMSLEGTKFLTVRWDDHEELGDALVKADDVDAVAEVVFRFWTHATIEYAYQTGAGSGLAHARWVRPRVVVGTGSWFRTSRDATRDTAHNMFVTLRKKYDATIVLLSDVEEASFEETATLYAHKETNLELPYAIISGGSGSTQASCVAPADIGDIIEAPEKLWKQHLELEDGAATVVHRWHSECSHVYEDHHGAKVKHFDESKEYWGYVYDIEFSGRRGLYRVDNIERVIKRNNGATRQSAPHLIDCGVSAGRKLLKDAATVGEGADEWRKRINTKFSTAGFNRDAFIRSCTLMGTCFYAAKYAKVSTCVPDESGGMILREIPVKEARELFEKAAEKILTTAEDIEEKACGTSSTDQTLKLVRAELGVHDDKLDQVLSNLLIQIRICKMLGDAVKVRYVRDWTIGTTKFRTTWSAGYYLQDVVRRRPNLLAEEGTGFKDLI